MPKIYEDCEDEVSEIVDALFETSQAHIAGQKPKIGYYFIDYDEDTKEAAENKHRELPPVLKLHGVACAATIKINSYKARVQGHPDVTVTISKAAWEEFDDGQRAALLDHELTHLIVCGETDDLGRPCFKMRPHDYDLSIFGEVVRRHGKAALEVKMTVNFLTSEDGQMIMDFGGLKQLGSTPPAIPVDWQDRNAPGMTGEKLVDIAAKMYTARCVVKNWAGDKYAVQIKPFMDRVAAEAKASKTDNYCSAALGVMKKCKTVNDQIWTLAAAVEIAEPSFKHPYPDTEPLNAAIRRPANR